MDMVLIVRDDETGHICAIINIEGESIQNLRDAVADFAHQSRTTHIMDRATAVAEMTALHALETP